MGRRKAEVKMIENKSSRQVTFTKRRQGLLKKTHELSVLCDAQIGLIIFSSKGRLFQYSSHPHSMGDIIERYHQTTGSSIPHHDNQEEMWKEMRQLKQKTMDLQLSLQRYKGDDLSFVRVEELDQLERQLEHSVKKVRARKFELLQQQLDNLQRSEKLLEKENQEMYQWLMNNQIQKHQAEVGQEDQQAVTELKFVEVQDEQHQQQQVLEQFPFYGEEQPSDVLLQLATTLHDNPYRLQPIQPNLQDATANTILHKYGGYGSDHYRHHHDHYE